MSEWISCAAAAELLGMTRRSAQNCLRREIADGDKTRNREVELAGVRSDAIVYRRSAIERLVAERERRRAEPRRRKHRGEPPTIGAPAGRAPRKGRRRKTTPLDRRVAAVAERVGVEGDLGRELAELRNAVRCAPDAPGAVRLSASTWVRPGNFQTG